MFPQEMHLLINSLSTFVIAVATVVMVWLSWGVLRENKRLRRIGSEPEVVAYLTTNKYHNTLVDFVLANIGKGAAKNIEFVFDCDEGDFRSHGVRILNKAERKPISVLPQDEKVVAYFGQGSSLFKEPRLKEFKVKVTYQNLAGEIRSGSFSLDVSEFDGLGMAGKPADILMAESLKKIESTLKSFTKNGVFKVVAYTPDDLRVLEVEERREFEEFQKSIKLD